MDLAYLPGLKSEELNRFFILDEEIYYSGIQRLLDRNQRNAYYREQEFDVAPVTDDRPFFFHFFRWGQLDDVLNRLGTAWQPFGGAGFLVILAFLALTLVASTLLILVPLALARPRGPGDARSEGAARWGILGYFLLLGLSFFLFVRNLQQIAWEDFLGFCGIYALSHVVGLVAVFAPAGFGVRDGTLSVQLSHIVPEGIAEVLAFGARIWFTLVELVSYLAMLIICPKLPKVVTSNKLKDTGKPEAS